MDVAKNIPDLTDLANRDPASFQDIIDKFREDLNKRPIKEENKKIGKNVELCIQKIIKDKNFKTKVIYKGADLEFWPDDNLGWDSGQLELDTFLMEIKFTSGNRVHLSTTQGDLARTKKHQYLVLVVENKEGLREQLKSDLIEDSIPDTLISSLVKNSRIIPDFYLTSFPTINSGDSH